MSKIWGRPKVCKGGKGLGGGFGALDALFPFFLGSGRTFVGGGVWPLMLLAVSVLSEGRPQIVLSFV